jgi:hypothetical protein
VESVIYPGFKRLQHVALQARIMAHDGAKHPHQKANKDTLTLVYAITG